MVLQSRSLQMGIFRPEILPESTVVLSSITVLVESHCDVQGQCSSVSCRWSVSTNMAKLIPTWVLHKQSLPWRSSREPVLPPSASQPMVTECPGCELHHPVLKFRYHVSLFRRGDLSKIYHLIHSFILITPTAMRWWYWTEIVHFMLRPYSDECKDCMVDKGIEDSRWMKVTIVSCCISELVRAFEMKHITKFEILVNIICAYLNIITIQLLSTCIIFTGSSLKCT